MSNMALLVSEPIEVTSVSSDDGEGQSWNRKREAIILYG